MKNFNHFFTTAFILISLNLNAQTNGVDPNFGDEGMVKTDINGKFDDATDIYILDNGKILAAGNSMVGSHYEFAVAQFLSDGTLDESFGESGFATIEFSTFHCLVKAITVQEDGKIILVGNYDNNYYTDPAIARFNEDGTIDTTFGVDGLVKFDLSAQFDDFNDVVVQPDGKIVVAGSSYKYGTDDFLLVRFNEDGSTDNSFGVDGFVYSDFDETEDVIYSVLLQKDKKILVSGYSGYGSVYFAAARYLENGLLDPTFSIDGKITIESGSRADKSYSMAFQSDSSIVLAGNHHAGATDEYMFARISTFGVLDNTFGTGGILYISTLNATDIIKDVVVQSDDKIVACGSRNNEAVFVRVTRNGALDNTFGVDGILMLAEADNTNILNALAITADNFVIGAGSANQDDYSDFLLLQINVDIQSSIHNTNGVIVSDNIYPNPAKNNITIKLNTEFGNLQEIGIYSLNGEEVYSQRHVSSQHSISITLPSQLQPGLYFVNLKYEKGNTSTKIQIIK